MAFPKKNKLVTPPIEDINGKFQEVRVKVVPGGVNAKKWKIPGGLMLKLTENPGRSKP